MFKPSPPIDFLKSLLDKSSTSQNLSQPHSPISHDVIDSFTEKAKYLNSNSKSISDMNGNFKQ